jgi:UDP:flavonoid glycosyltransferase YjiC (YdhE family)
VRILFVSLRSDDLGLPSRLLPIAAELRARGHDVAFASPDPAPARLIAGAGFGNLECPPMRAPGSKVPTLVADAIGTLLGDPRYAGSARAAAQQLAALPGAADVIETLPRA